MSADTSPPSIVPCVAWYSIHELGFHQNWSQEKEACSNCVMCEIKKGKKCDDFYFTREACWRVYFLSFTPLFVMGCKYLKRKGKQVVSKNKLQLFSRSGVFATFLILNNANHCLVFRYGGHKNRILGHFWPIFQIQFFAQLATII